VGDDRAETYLRRLAETEFRRVPRIPSDIAGSVARVRWAGEVLAEAGVLAGECVTRIAAELDAALTARADAEPSWRATRLSRILRQPDGGWPPGAGAQGRRAAQPTQITPLGRMFRVAGGRAPADLHLMTLVRTPADAVITVAMRMHWPPDGSSADLEIAGAGPEHLPYDHLWVVDDRGTRYRLLLDGVGGTTAWLGVLQLSPAPPPGTRWLDLIGDVMHRLIRLDLADRKTGAPAVRSTTEPNPAVAPGERLLARQAERIMASARDRRGPSADQRLGEMITVLATAGAIAPDSPAPGHLAALCQRLGVQGHGISAPAAADIPGPWASVLAGLDAEPAGPGPEWFAPLGVVLPDADGTRFALAGLTSAAGESHVHVEASGVPESLSQPSGSRFSWWVRDDAGRWHVGTEVDPSVRASGQATFRLRLTPPLSARPDTIEVAVTGPATRVGALVPVREAPGMPDT
jgi:hypothetical protein